MKWKNFYFNGDLIWGGVESPDDWQVVVEKYKAEHAGDPLDARSCAAASEFGFKSYHRGMMLRKFFEINGMEA